MPQTAEVADLIADVRERVRYLQELGVESLDVDLEKLRLSPVGSEISDETAPRPIEPLPPARIIAPDKISVPEAPAGSRLSTLPSLANRKSAMPAVTAPKPDLFGDIPPDLPEPVETIEQIRVEIGPDCTRCKLSSLGRSQVVNSTGSFNADLMFVGEAPGADEDAQGEPFVGRAGQLLTKIIESIGLDRKDVFIGNINRCRPPGNRAPEADESVACKPFLKREIAVVRPKVIVVLGATAAQNLLETKTPIGKLRGHFHDHLGVKVMPTFHPAYLLRDPHKKREVWEDMKMVRDYLASVH